MLKINKIHNMISMMANISSMRANSTIPVIHMDVIDGATALINRLRMKF